MSTSPTQSLGHLIESVHAPVYFALEPAQAYAALGLRGYWRGYFASRSAALGQVSAATVTALFGGFAPAMVERAIDEIWTISTPEAVLEARQSGAAAALNRLGLTRFGSADSAEVVQRLGAVVRDLDLSESPMAAAHASIEIASDGVTALWQLCTVLREYRGDAHLALVEAHGLSWPQPHLLLEPTGRLDPQQREFRGWTEAEWDAAREALRARGLYDTAAGYELIETIDAETSWLVEPVFGGHAAELIDLLTPLATAARVDIPFPNAMGLPQPQK